MSRDSAERAGSASRADRDDRADRDAPADSASRVDRAASAYRDDSESRVGRDDRASRVDRADRGDRADSASRVDPARVIRAAHIRSSAHLYGPERSLLEIGPALARIGALPRIVLLYRRPFQGPAAHPLVAPARRRGLDVEQVEDRSPLSAMAVRRAVKAARGADILHGHDYKANLVAYLAARHSRGPRRPWVATMHLHTASTARLRAYRALDLALLRRADAVFTVSKAQAAALAGRGIPAARIETAPTVLDVDAYAAAAVDRATARAAIGIGPEVPLVFAAGRLTRQKGFDVLLASVPAIRAAVPGVRILVAGDGPERAALEAAIRAGGLGDVVRCIGYVDGVSGLLAAADVVAAPSRDEGLPLLLLEALALARPVVATPVGGVPEIVEDGQTGRLVPVDDGRALAAAIVELLTHPGEAVRLGEAGRARVRERHAPGVVAAVIGGRYRALVGARGGLTGDGGEADGGAVFGRPDSGPSDYA